MRRKTLWTRIVAGLSTAALITGLTTGLAGNVKAADADGDSGRYHAALGVQTFDLNGKCAHRFGYYNSSINNTYGTEQFTKLVGDAWKKKPTQIWDATCTDVELAGNGTYTVAISADFQGDKVLSQLHVATDIPTGNKKIKISNVSVSINNVNIPQLSYDTGYRETDSNQEKGGQVFLLLNHWRSELVEALKKKGLPENGDRQDKDGYTLLNGSGVETISITFTASGFNYDYVPPAPGTTSTPAPAASATPQPTSSTDPGNTGSTQTAENQTVVKGVTYQVSNDTAKAVKAQKKQASYSIADTVTINGSKYKVTEIGKSAFAGNTKVTKITVGKNVTVIGKNAFSGCKKLKTVNLKKTKGLKTVGKNAFKNVNKNCTALVPASKKSAYKNILKGIKVK